MNSCHTCGGEIGEHLGQCPEDALAFEILSALSDPRRLAALVTVPREALRLEVEEVSEQLRLD